MIRIALDKAALERLLGGDSEVEVKLRQSVLEDFARRHLKVLVTAAEPWIQGDLDRLKEKLQRDFDIKVSEQIASIDPRSYKSYTFKPDIEEALRRRVTEVFHKYLEAFVTERLEAFLVRTEENRTRQIETLVAARVEKSLEAMVDAALLARLEKLKEKP